MIVEALFLSIIVCIVVCNRMSYWLLLSCLWFFLLLLVVVVVVVYVIVWYDVYYDISLYCLLFMFTDLALSSWDRPRDCRGALPGVRGAVPRGHAERDQRHEGQTNTQHKQTPNSE